MKSVFHSPTSAQESWCVVHAVSLRDQAAMAEIRAMALPHKGKLRGTAARAAFDGIIGHTRAPTGVTFRRDTVASQLHCWSP